MIFYIKLTKINMIFYIKKYFFDIFKFIVILQKYLDGRFVGLKIDINPMILSLIYHTISPLSFQNIS